MVIAVSPFRSYFVWLALWCTRCLVTGVPFLFVYLHYFYFAVCLFGGVLLCLRFGWVLAMRVVCGL